MPGRWSYATPEFTEAPRTQFASGRARKVESVSMSMRHSGARHSDQGEVWNEIAEKAACLSTHSPTSAMCDMYRDRQPQLEDYAQPLREATADSHGAAFAVGSRLVGLDIFDQASTCDKLAGKVLAGYALEAISEPADRALKAPTPGAVKRSLADLVSGQIQSYPAPQSSLTDGFKTGFGRYGKLRDSSAGRGRIAFQLTFGKSGI